MLEAELRREIAAKKLRNCYLLYGEEQYVLRAILSKIANESVGKDDGMNRNDFDSSSSFGEVFDAATSMPFFADKRLVVWCDPPYFKGKAEKSEDDGDKKGKGDELTKLITSLPPTTVLVIWLETVEINEKRPPAAFKNAVKAIEACEGVAVNFMRKTQGEINKLLIDGASRRGAMLHQSVAVYMTERCGNDLSTLVGELNKVCAYAHGTTVTKEIVDEVCAKNVDVSIYDLSKKLLTRDMKGVYSILDELFFMKTEPIYILATLSSSFVDMYRAKTVALSGENIQTAAASLGYSKNLEFRLTNAARDARNISVEALGDCLTILSECDKTLKSSRISGRTAIEALVTDIAMRLARDK